MAFWILHKNFTYTFYCLPCIKTTKNILTCSEREARNLSKIFHMIKHKKLFQQMKTELFVSEHDEDLLNLMETVHTKVKMQR